MKLAHFFIDHPRFAAVLSVFITVAGLVTMLFLPIAQYPSIVPPTIDITTNFPGASADTIARTVATPIEQAVNGVENMDYITSQSTSDGALTTTIYFKIGSDPNLDLILTRNRVLDAGFTASAGSSASGREGEQDNQGAGAWCARLFTGWLAQSRISLQLHAEDTGPDIAPAWCFAIPTVWLA